MSAATYAPSPLCHIRHVSIEPSRDLSGPGKPACTGYQEEPAGSALLKGTAIQVAVTAG